MYLHDAIATILRENGHPMLDSEIADINKQKGYFIRPTDGLPPEDWQVRLRATNYPNMLKVSGHMISLIEWEI